MLAIGVEDGAVVRYVLYERGSVVDEYQSVPEYFGPLPPGDVVALGANPTVVARLTGAEPAAVRAVARTAASPDELPPADELLQQLAEVLGSRAPGAGRLETCSTLYDADRCPYCARARIVLAEKGIEYEAVEIDLADRPAWMYEKNPTGRVPVLEEDDGLVLPESEVIMEYLEERYPEPRAAGRPIRRERALGRLWILPLRRPLGDAVLRGCGAARTGAAAARRSGSPARRALEAQPYLERRRVRARRHRLRPWILRARDMLRRSSSARRWRSGSSACSERPAVAAEAEPSSRRCD